MIAERTVKDTELDKVLEIIRKNALSPEGKARITSDLVIFEESVIEKRSRKIEEYLNLLSGVAPDPFPSISDIFTYVESTHADIHGEDIYKAGEFLHSYISMLVFLEKEDEIHEEDKELSSEILSSIDNEGNVYEDHPRLLPLIRKRDEIRSERVRYSSRFISEHRTLVQQSEAMFRNERVVIPIRSDQKRIPGCYISGASSSGNTLFAEPAELLALNNDAVIAEERIRAEKMKILHELSDKVRNLVPVLKDMLERVIEFDFYYSFALWVKRSKAVQPRRGKTLSLIAARHPLLGEKAVPITITLPEGVTALVLSGANAGGKTVTMKTIALLALLNQIGGYIPADAHSVLPLYSSVFTDIGDGQSILDAASTFSSHMKNIAEICNKADGNSLVILDELGSGTDPEEGAALSRSMLSYFSKHTALTCITSHYSQVKSFAYSEMAMMNASMEFDERSGLPTYRVLEGIPGDSHALETAKRMRIPKEIIEAAAEELRGGDATTGRIIKALISKERTLDRKITEISILKKKEEKSREEFEKKEKELEKKENELRKEGVKEINDYLRSTRKELERLVMDVRTGNLTQEKTRRVKSYIKSVEEVKAREESLIDDTEEIVEDTSPINPGDLVLCGSSRALGHVVAVKANSVTVSLENGLRMDIKRNMVHHAPKSEKKTSVEYGVSTRKADYTIDVRGLTLEEALRRVEDQIEAAILSSLPSFSIIHGYGDGILSRGIHEYLKKRKEIKDYRFARPEDGGMGKTYVELF